LAFVRGGICKFFADAGRVVIFSQRAELAATILRSASSNCGQRGNGLVFAFLPPSSTSSDMSDSLWYAHGSA
jgi:hypothetical protein